MRMDEVIQSETSPLSGYPLPNTTKEEKEKALLMGLHQYFYYSATSPAETQHRICATEDYQFYAGKQEPESVRLENEMLKRPNVVFNEIKPKIDMLVGVAADYRQEPKLLPIEAQDEITTEMLTGSYKYYRYQLRVQRRELECFEHMVKCGRSYLHYYIDPTSPFSPTLRCIRIPSADVYTDPEGIEYDLSDHRFIFVAKWLTSDQIKMRWPDLDESAFTSLSTLPVSTPSNFPASINWVSADKKKYRLVEGWYWEYETRYWFKDKSGRGISITKEEKVAQEKMAKDVAMQENREVQPLEFTQYPAKVLKYAIFTGWQLFEHGEAPKELDMFPFVPFGAYKDDESNAWFGVVKTMKDPQIGLNAMRRQLLHMLMTAPKPLLMYETGSILNLEEYKKKSSEPNFALELRSGSLASGKVKFNNQPQISPLYTTLDQFFSQSMKSVSGIVDDLMGVYTSSREPGISVQLRQQSGLTVLNSLFSNYRESRIMSAKLLLFFIQNYLPLEDHLKILGQQAALLLQQNPALVELMKNTKFDVIIDEEAEGSSIRLAIAKMLTEFSQTNPGQIPPAVILEFTNIPLSVKQKISEFQNQQAQQAAEQRKEDLALEYAKIDAKKQSKEKSDASAKK